MVKDKKLRKSLLEKLKDPVFRIKFILYLSSVLIIILVISGWAIYFTSTPTFCTFCHNMKPYARSLEKSTHSRVTCYGCHGQRGMFSWIVTKAIDLKSTYYLATDNYEKPINAKSKLSEELPTFNCEYCHSITQRKVTPTNGIKINHKKHIDKGINCTKCHNRVSHNAVKGYEGEKYQQKIVFLGKVIKSKFYPNHLKMRYCMECHKYGEGDLKGPGACTTCHPKDFEFKPPSHRVYGFFPRPLPNGVPNSIHGEGGRADKDYCLSCHDEEKLCTNCHGITMPHPEDWAGGRNLHPAYGKKNIKLCYKCHEGKDICNSCHHNATGEIGRNWFSKIPGQTTHLYFAKQMGAANCMKKCHGPLFCARCHVTGSPFKN